MTWLPDIRQPILDVLLIEPAHQFELAEQLDEPPFRIRGELAKLRRDRLVRNTFRGGRERWELTDRGLKAATARDENQLPLWDRTI